MASTLGWCLLLAGVSVSFADPDFYSAWCPCKPQYQCPVPYGSFFDDIAIFGQVPPCKKFNFVRCCSVSDIPEGFDLERPAVYLPERVPQEAEPVHSQQAALLAAAASGQPRRRGGARRQDAAASAPVASRALDLNAVQQRQDVIDFKAAQEKLKRDIANGIDNPNPPCGCYSEGTCPGRYATKSTGRDIGCLPGYETCCFLDDPWPNYQVTNLTINAPCSIAEACARFFGTSPFDISSFGPLEPCYLGQNRCLDYLQEGSNVQPSVVRPQIVPTTPRPTRRPTTRRTTTTRRPVTRPPPSYRPVVTTSRRPFTFRPVVTTSRKPFTFRPVTTYRTTTERATTYRTSARPTLTPFRTTTQRTPEPEPQPSGGSSNIIDVVTNGAYLPPSRDFGSAANRAEPAGLTFDLPF